MTSPLKELPMKFQRNGAEAHPVNFPYAGPRWHELTRKIFWLRLLVGLLLVSNLVLGCLAFWSVKASDLAYSALLEKNLPLLEKLGSIAVDYSRVQRRHLNLFLVEPKDADAMRQECAALLGQAKESLASAGVLLSDSSLDFESAEISQFAGIYVKSLEQFDQLLRDGKRQEAADYARLSLRPSLENLLRYTDQLDSRIRGDALRQSKLISANNTAVSKLFFGLAGWPLFFVLGTVALFTVIVIILCFLALRLRLDERE